MIPEDNKERLDASSAGGFLRKTGQISESGEPVGGEIQSVAHGRGFAGDAWFRDLHRQFPCRSPKGSQRDGWGRLQNFPLPWSNQDKAWCDDLDGS